MAAPRGPAEALSNLLAEARFGVAFLQANGLRLLLVFAGLLLPLWVFSGLAGDVRAGEPFRFDEPIMRFVRQAAGAGLDRVFLLSSKLGYEWGVVPVDVVLVLVLAFLGRHREALFAGIALGGSALLNIVAKQAFARERPGLWQSIAPEDNYSFPSGHAMGSMTLALVLVLLAWPTRWRMPAIVAMAVFVPMVGMSRVYLGVHYPSDIVAGWAAASAWTVSVYLLVFRGRTLSGARRAG